MNGESAYGGEMNELALFESALRAAVPTQPDPRLGAVLVPRLAEAAARLHRRGGDARAQARAALADAGW